MFDILPKLKAKGFFDGLIIKLLCEQGAAVSEESTEAEIFQEMQRLSIRIHYLLPRGFCAPEGVALTKNWRTFAIIRAYLDFKNNKIELNYTCTRYENGYFVSSEEKQQKFSVSDQD